MSDQPGTFMTGWKKTGPGGRALMVWGGFRAVRGIVLPQHSAAAKVNA